MKNKLAIMVGYSQWNNKTIRFHVASKDVPKLGVALTVPGRTLHVFHTLPKEMNKLEAVTYLIGIEEGPDQNDDVLKFLVALKDKLTPKPPKKRGRTKKVLTPEEEKLRQEVINKLKSVEES